ncbi:hypothetical protein H4582DRAFT_386128 [Lactarius indigo]|nr:hypothetical protein H4582DRAFT_386128 [Lactarius indigo]
MARRPLPLMLLTIQPFSWESLQRVGPSTHSFAWHLNIPWFMNVTSFFFTVKEEKRLTYNYCTRDISRRSKFSIYCSNSRRLSRVKSRPDYRLPPSTGTTLCAMAGTEIPAGSDPHLCKKQTADELGRPLIFGTVVLPYATKKKR